jgi:hypothetical protein
MVLQVCLAAAAQAFAALRSVLSGLFGTTKTPCAEAKANLPNLQTSKKSQ